MAQRRPSLFIVPRTRRRRTSCPAYSKCWALSYQCAITPEDFLAYFYGVLAQPAFTELFAKELESRALHVPITMDATLFEQVRAVGAHLLWLHTYGERFVPEGKPRDQIPPGAARCTVAVPGDADGYPEKFAYNDENATLHVGAGEFAPAAPELFAFEVSGLKVVQSWLKYRMKKGAAKKSSPLDDIRPTRWTSQFTTELLELLWVLEATLARLSRTSPTPPASHRQRLLPRRRTAARAGRDAKAAAGGAVKRGLFG